MGYVSFLKRARPTCVDIKIPTREKGFVLNIILGTPSSACLLVELRKRVVVWLLAKMKLVCEAASFTQQAVCPLWLLPDTMAYSEEGEWGKGVIGSLDGYG